MTNTIEINGELFTKQDKEICLDYKIIRTYAAGVFMAQIESRVQDEAVLINSKRIHYWNGAASLSQLAMEGTSDKENCRIPCAVSRMVVRGVIEILDMTEKAKNSIDSVPVWSK